ncbi:hypothetical protein RYX56_11000 [Alkalihalophilus lindianensis]|uniref:Uncharacterized protein n=1 Tax=Alkalihalophilus lindianensis TaxID=1630542 RepID=A0ABU3XAH0_9BACI|nr:hypothetical protein [Alkalihalophilus lindianensis]MDV2684896.1 hypothetical protein [Alkalihalophilus lindianensis]
MLVEINLLPEKPRKNYTSILYVGGFVFLVFLAIASTFLYQRHISSEIEEIKQEAYDVQVEAAIVTQELTGVEFSNLDQIEQAVVLLESHIIPASLVVDFLVSQLPERGFISHFSYTQPEDVQFDISFDRLEEIAQYYEALDSSELVDAVRLSIIDAHEMMDDEEYEIDFDEVKSRYIASFDLLLDREYAQSLGENQ